MTTLADVLAASAARTAARVVAAPDPKVPGRTSYRITGPTAAAVQRAIDRIMGSVEDGTGFGQFTWPVRFEDGWSALGETMTHGL